MRAYRMNTPTRRRKFARGRVGKSRTRARCLLLGRGFIGEKRRDFRSDAEGTIFAVKRFTALIACRTVPTVFAPVQFLTS
jgi:hypothetical protein